MKLDSLLETAGVKLAFSSHTFMNATPHLESHAACEGTAQDTILVSGKNGPWRISVDSAELNSLHQALDIEVEWQHSGHSQQTAAEVRLEFAH